MEIRAKMFTTGMRFAAAFVTIEFETMGKKLLPGETLGHGLQKVFTDTERSNVAANILRLIYPKGSNEVYLPAVRKFFLSTSMLRMANFVVASLGKVNIGVGIVGTKTAGAAAIPYQVFPLSAMLVSYFIYFISQTSSILTQRHPGR